MSRSALYLLVVSGLFAVPPGALPRAPAQQAFGKGDALRPGMSPAQVRALLGRPTRISRQIILFRSLQQWHYTQPPLRLTFDCPRGLPPALLLPSPTERHERPGP